MPKYFDFCASISFLLPSLNFIKLMAINNKK